MALERPLTPQEEFDEQRTWLLEEKLHQQHQMARGQTGTNPQRLQTIESRIKMVQERLQYYATRRGESIDFYSREKARRQQEWHSRSDNQGIDITKAFTSNTAYGPMPPLSRWKPVPGTGRTDKLTGEVEDAQYRRKGTGQPTTRTLADIKLEPYQFPGTISPAYQGNADAQRRAERFYYRMRGALDVTAGMSPVEAMLRDPEINQMLRKGEISTQHLATAVGIMQDLRGQQMETALRQLAGESTSSQSFASPYLQSQMPSREKREAAVASAQAEIEAWREKTAKNAQITPGQLHEIYPHTSDEQLAFVKSLDENPQAVLKAGPGSGKTDTLLAGWLHLVFNKRVDPRTINFVSATKSGRDALYDRIKRATEIMPQWNIEEAKHEQFRTMHSLFLKNLYERDDQGEAAIDRMGMRQWQLVGSGSSNLEGKTLEAAAEQAESDNRRYLDRLLRENNIKRRQSLDKIANHISSIKLNQGQQTKLPDGSKTRQYEEHYNRGKALYRSGNTTDLDALFFLYESNLKRKEGMPGVQGQHEKRFDLDDVPYLSYIAGAKQIARQLKDTIVDEFQTLPPDMVRALRTNTSPQTHLFFAGDPGQHVMGVGRPDIMIPQAFPQIAQHTLTGNYRGTARSVATFNAINQLPVVQQTGFSPFQVSMSGKVGLDSTRTTASSFNELHQQGFHDALSRIGLDVQRVKQNIGQGAHPLAGAMVAPVQAPQIFTMNEERNNFLKVVEEELAKEVGPVKAKRAIGQIFNKENPDAETEFSSPLSNRQIPALLVQQAQSRGFAHPSLFVTRGGQWNEGDYWRMVNIMESRTTEQSHYYSTNKNFQYSRYDNSFDFDPATGTNLPHGFARIQSASYENLVYGQGVPYESLSPAEQYHVNMPLPESSGASNVALMKVIEGALDLQKAVPPGSRIGMIGEDAGLLPGQLEGEYGDDDKKTLPGFSISSFTHAAMSGKYSMGADYMRLGYGLQQATDFLQGGPEALTAANVPIDSVTGYMSAVKPFIGKAKDPRYDITQVGGKTMRVPTNVEHDQPAPSAIPGHDDVDKHWGQILEMEANYEPGGYREGNAKYQMGGWKTSRYSKPTREADEAHVRYNLKEFLRTPRVAQHPRIRPLLEAQYSKRILLGSVQHQARYYGYKGVADTLKAERNSIPREQIIEKQRLESELPLLHSRLASLQANLDPDNAEHQKSIAVLTKQIEGNEAKLRQITSGFKRQANLYGDAGITNYVSNLTKNEHYSKLGSFITRTAAYLVAEGNMTPELIQTLTEVAEDLASNGEVGEKMQGEFRFVADMLRTKAGAFIDHDQPMSLSEEELASIKRRSPRDAALLERILRDPNSGELKDFNKAYADLKQFQYLRGAMIRAVNTPERAAELGISIPESRRAPLQTEMQNYAQRHEESGIADPQAYIAREGKEGMQFFHTGEMIGLEMYQRRLQEIAYGQPREGRIQPSEDQRQLAYEQLGLVKQLRSELHSSTNQEAWGHTLNLLSRVVYAEGAYDPHDKSPEGQYTAGFRDMFKYQKMEGLEGSRTLEQVQAFVEAMQEGTSHIRQTGTIKREHVNRIMAALGHTDLEGEQYVGLRALANQFGSPESEFPLSDLTKGTDLVRQFPSDLNNQYSQLTRLPLGMGREYMFAGGIEGFAPIITGNAEHPGGQVGMTTGMRGTLLPWSASGKDFGMSKQKGAYIGERLFTPQESKAAYGLGLKDPLAPLFRFRESESGKTYPVRADQLIDPMYLPMLGASPLASAKTIAPPQESPIVKAPAGIGSGSNLTYLPGGDLFGSSMQALVNPVNTVGAMGKGLALQFKQRYPNMVPGYEQAVRSGTLQPGKLHYSQEYGPDRTIVQFPTKQDWHAPSRLEWIEQGLQEFTRTYKQQGITSAAFPMLGSGLGGLDWQTQVAPLMHKHLSGLDIPIEIYGAAPTTMTPQGPSPRVEAPAGVSSRGATSISASPSPSLMVSGAFPPLTIKSQSVHGSPPPRPERRSYMHPPQLGHGVTRPEHVQAWRQMVGALPPHERAAILSRVQARAHALKLGQTQTQGPQLTPTRQQRQRRGISRPRSGAGSGLIPGRTERGRGLVPFTSPLRHNAPSSTGLPLVEDQMRDLAGMIRTGSQEFGMHALSDEQRAAVEDPSRFRMISGGPGGGKTNTIAGATGDWIATGGMFPKDIVSVSALHSGEEELNSRLDTPRALARRGSDPRYELPKSSTIHSLAHDILLQKEEDGSYPNLEKQGITNFSGRILYEPSPAERETMTQAQYEQVSQLHFLKQQFPGLREKDARDALEFVNNMKANRSGEGTDYNAALELGRENLGATMVVGKGRGKRRVPTYEAALAQMQDAMSARGDLDYNDQIYYTARHLEQNGLEGLPMHLQSTTGLVLDEGQDITQTSADMVGQFLGAISENKPHMLIGMDPAQSLLPQTFGAVDVNKVEGLWEAMANGFGEPLSKHTLKENRRSNLGAIALNNAIRNRPELEGTARSPVQHPPEGGTAVGQYEQFHLAPTHPQLFRNMWHNMLKTAGVSYNDMAANVQAGKHPFAGIDFSSAGHVMPKDIPAILNEHRDQAIFAHEATEDIAKELGVSPDEAKKLFGQMTSPKMYKRPLISRMLRRSEKPSDEELEKMAHFPIVRHSGARSFDALSPHVDVTQSYGGDDPAQALVSHFKKMFVALSRVRSGGRNQVFATNRPLPAYEKEAYLKNPGAFGGGMTNAKGNFLPSDGDYAFKQYGNIQVPPHFDKILRDRDKELLEGGISPTDSFFPPEVQPAIQGIAQELGVGVQQPTQTPGISPDEIIRKSTPPPAASSAGGITSSPSSPPPISEEHTPLEQTLHFLSAEKFKQFRQGVSPQEVEQLKQSLHSYPELLAQQFAQQQNNPDALSATDYLQGERGRILGFLKGPAAIGTKAATRLGASARAMMIQLMLRDPERHFVQQQPPVASGVAGVVASPVSSPTLSLEDLAVQMVQNHPDYGKLNPMEQKAVEQSLQGYPERLRTGFSKAAPKGITAGEFLRGRYEGLDYNSDQLSNQPGMHWPQNVTIDSMQELIRHIQKNPDQHLNAQNVTIKTGAHSVVTIDTGAGGGGGTGQRPPGTGGTPGGTLPPGVTQGGPGANALSYLGQFSGNQLNFGAALPPQPPPGTGTSGGGDDEEERSPFDPRNEAIMAQRTLDRISGDMTRTGETLKQTADNAAKEGSDYRMATLGVVPKKGSDDFGNTYGDTSSGTTPGEVQGVISGIVSNVFGGVSVPGRAIPGAQTSGQNNNFTDQGAEGFFNFRNTGSGTIAGLQQQYLQWYSKTQIAQGIHDYIASTGAQFNQSSVGATTDIMGIAALAQMDPSQLSPMMAQVSGYTAGSPNGNNANINQLAAYMGTTFNGNFSQANVVPYLSAMQNLVPTLYGAGLNQGVGPGTGINVGPNPGNLNTPDYGTAYSGQSQLHAASLLKLAMNAGYTAQDLPDISTMLGTLTQAGMTPNVQQQYQFAQMFGEKNLTASPQYFEFQQQQLSQKQQIQQMQAGLNVNAGIAGAQKLSISQLQIEADNASIQLNQANLQMSQEQFAQNQASFNFNQWMQTQELGPIGETPQQTGRAGYFNYMNRQMGAGYNPLNADSASNFQLRGQPFGLQNAEFYAGIENQRNMLTLSRSPLLADAAYQQQMKYLNEQETFYSNQLQLQNKDRAFQQTWGQRSLDAQGKVLAAEQHQSVIQIEQLNYDKAQAKIQGQYYGQFLTLLQQIQKQSLQQIQGQGPLNGRNVTPENLIQQLAGDMKSKGYNYAQSEIQGLGLDAQSQGELSQLVAYLAKGGSLSKIESQMSGSQVSSLMSELQQYEQQGASSGAQQHAGNADKNLAQGGTQEDWKNLTDAVTNSVNANNTLAQYLAPTSSLQKYLGELGTNTGSLTGQISSLIPLFGGLSKGLGGLDTLIEIFAGGAGGAGGMGGSGGGGGTGGSMLPLPSMQVHGPFGGALGGRGRGGPGIGGEFDMGPSLPNNADTRGWLNLFETMVSRKQQRTNQQTVDHYGISSPTVNADFHQKLWYGIHQGVDFAAAQGTPLLSFNDGTVKNTGFFPWGGEVDVQIPGGMIERYLHLSQIGVSSGQKLKAGDRIGLTGGGTKQSGLGYWSKGPHSHVQIDTGNINQGINPWVIWEAFGDTNLRDFYVGAQAQYNAQIDSQTGSRGYQRSGGGAGLFHMADGGIAMRPLATRLGDGGEPEAVIPLSKLKSVMASVASGSPTSATTTHTSPSKTVTIQTLVGNMHVTINTQAATMSDQEKDNLFTDLIDVLHQASQELLGTLQ